MLNRSNAWRQGTGRVVVLGLLASGPLSATLTGCGDPFVFAPDPLGTSTGSSSASSAGVGGGSGGADGEGGGMAASATSTAGTGGAAASPLTHTILVVDAAKMPISGVPLLVNDEAGALLFASASDNLGQATFDVPHHGSVSALSSSGSHFEVISFFDPTPGAPITLGIAAPEAPVGPPPLAATTFKVTFSLPPGATSWSCRNTCSANVGAPGEQVCTITNSACAEAPSQDVLVLAYNGTTVLGWTTALAIPVSPGGTVERSLPPMQPVAAVGVQITDIPGDFVSAGATIAANASSNVGIPFDSWGAAPSSSLALGFVVPSGLAGGYDITESAGALKATSIVGVERRRHYANIPALASFAANAIPRIYVHQLDVTEPGRPLLTWSVGPGSLGDYGKVVLAWHDGESTFGFTAYLPTVHNGNIRFPEVPAVLGPFAPSATSWFTLSSIAYEDVETIDGYAAALTSLYGGLPAQDGLGVVRSYGTNLPSL